MRVENLNHLMSANAITIRIAEAKQRKMLELKIQQNGFRFVDSDNPTQAELDIKQGQADLGILDLQMTDLQTAFNEEKAVFQNPDIIIVPVD